MRYEDSNLTLHRTDDFTTRHRIPSLAQFIVLFTINYAVVTAAYFISDTFLQFAIITILMLAVTDSIVVWSVQRSRDLVLVTEFQNALFASALSMNSHFCLILRKDGLVVYTDMGFRAMYPQFERALHRNIDDIFQMAAVSREDQGPILQLVTSGGSGSGTVNIRDGDGLTHRMMVYIDPIRRPRDYVLLRARPYIEKRTGSPA